MRSGQPFNVIVKRKLRHGRCRAIPMQNVSQGQRLIARPQRYVGDHHRVE
jgi:hypothetical protein